MAEGDYGRTFPNDPNPPPRPLEAPAVSTAPAAEFEEGGGGGAAPSPAVEPSRPAKAVFRVSTDEDGRRSVYMMDDKLETTNLGPVAVDDADNLLTALGAYNEVTGSWEVPEAAAKQLLQGDLPVPDYVLAKYRSNKALIARGAIMTEWLSGKTELEDALGRADLETIKMQVKEAPLFVYRGSVAATAAKMWEDLRAAGLSGAARRTAGEAAGLAAFTTDSPFLVAGGLTIGASLIAAQAAPGAGQAAGGLAAAALVKGLETGAGALVFKRSYEIEGGNAAAEMLEKGFDPTTVKKYAPAVGVINGALEVVSFRLLAAPFKRVILRNVLGNAAVRKTLASAVSNYAKELGGEIGQEEAQEMVNVIAESMAADAEARPDLKPTGEEALTRGMEVGLKTLMGVGVVKAPGLALEAGVNASDAKVRAERAQKVEAALKPAETQKQATSAAGETPSVVQPGEKVAAPPSKPGQAASPTPAPAASPAQAAETLYHGTVGEIKEFQGMLWVTPDKEAASGFADRQAFNNRDTSDEDYRSADQYSPEFDKPGDVGQRVMELEADVKNPLDLRDLGQSSTLRKVAEKLAEKGIFEKLDEDTLEAVVDEMEWAENESPSADKRIPVYRALEALDAYRDAQKKGHDAVQIVDTDVHGKPVDAVGIFESKGRVRPRGDITDYFPRQERVTAEVDEAVKAANDKTTAPEDTAARVDAALDEMDATPRTYGEKIIEAERKGLLETRRRELVANQREITAKEAEIARLEKSGLGVAVQVRQLDKLLEENANLRGDIEFYDKAVPQQVGIEGSEDLTLKPATLENIAELGFTEGRKEVLTTRRKAVHDVAQRLDLTAADLSGILKEKNYGTMGDVEFRNWLETKFKPAAKERFKRKVATREVRRVQAERRLEQERNVRLQAKLPSIDKMTTEQLFDYADLLSTFDKGDRVLTPKRQRSLETTDLEGARTLGEVAKRVRELGNYPADTMTRLLPDSGFVGDLRRGLAKLAARSPMHKAMVQTMEASTEREDIARMAWREKMLALGAKALASRKSFLGRFVNPTMPEVFAHLNSDDAQVYAGQVTLPTLTPEEQEFVDYVEASYEDAYGYLVRVDGLKSRYTGTKGYVTYVGRDLVEMIADIKDTGWRAFFKELKDQWVPQEENFRIVSRTGGSIGLRAHIKYATFRTGEMTPTKNVIRAVDTYFRAFHKKKALDRAVPQIDTMVDALKWLDGDKSPDAAARREAFEKYVGQYLSAKKGQTFFADWAPHGGFFDVLFRGLTTLPSLAWVAFNPKLQAAAGVGELMATIPVVGVDGLARATYLMARSKEARAFLDNNTGFTGETVWARLNTPGKTLNETSGLLMYGLLQEWRVRALQLVLLADATEAEIKSGTIAPERLADIKAHAARWMDVKDSKSVLGSTSLGALITQFKGWALPIMETTLEDFGALAKQMAGKGEMTPMQKRELVRLLYTTSTVALVSAWVSAAAEEDDDSWSAMLLRSIHREMWSLTSGASPWTVFAAPPAVGYYLQLFRALKDSWEGVADIATGAEEPRGVYKRGEREGELRGPRALARLLPGSALLRQLGIIESPQRRK